MYIPVIFFTLCHKVSDNEPVCHSRCLSIGSFFAEGNFLQPLVGLVSNLDEEVIP